MSYLADLIRTRREAAGLTRAELARKLDVPWRTLWRWETGVHQPRPDTLARIMAALDRPRRKR